MTILIAIAIFIVIFCFSVGSAGFGLIEGAVGALFAAAITWFFMAGLILPAVENDERMDAVVESTGLDESAFPKRLPEEGETFKVETTEGDRICRTTKGYTQVECLDGRSWDTLTAADTNAEADTEADTE